MDLFKLKSWPVFQGIFSEQTFRGRVSGTKNVNVYKILGALPKALPEKRWAGLHSPACAHWMLSGFG